MGGGRGLNLIPNFQKGKEGGLAGPQFLQKKLKCEIFNDKISS